MKPLLTILILLPCMCFGQKKDSSVFNNVIESSLMIMNRDSVHGEYSITFYSDSTIEIYGDTIRVLWMMQKYIIEYSERYWAAIGVLDRLNLQKLKELIKSKSINTAVNNYLETEKKYRQQKEK